MGHGRAAPRVLRRSRPLDPPPRPRAADPHRVGHAFVDFYRTHFGSVLRTFARLDEAAGREYAAALREILLRHNRATDGTIAAAFAYVTVGIAT